MLGGRKTPFILEAFEQERTAQTSRTRLIGQEVQVFCNQGEVFNQFFDISLTFHGSVSLQFFFLSQRGEANMVLVSLSAGKVSPGLALFIANVQNAQERWREDFYASDS